MWVSILLIGSLILPFHQLSLVMGSFLLTYNIYVYHTRRKIYPKVIVHYFLFYVGRQFMVFSTILFIILVPEYSTSKHLIKTIEECYYKALYYIGSSLSCLQYFKNYKDIMVCNKRLTYKFL